MKTMNLFLFASPLFLAPLIFAQPQTLKVDPQASEVAITLKDIHSTVHGAFHVQSGAVEFDPGTARISGSVVVAAGSGKTGSDTRDKRMAREVLEAPKFSDIAFVPKSYTGTLSATGDSDIQVTGVFTLHGAPHDLTVSMKVHMESGKCTAKTHFVVPYVKWGLKDPSIMILKVAKEVDVDLTLVGTLAAAS
jgi:polyisoprenoid-binding protein YceI